MDTSFEILQPESEFEKSKSSEKSFISSAKPDLREAEERRNTTSQLGTKLHRTEGGNREISSGTKILSDAISFAGSNQSGSVVRNKVSDSPGKRAKAKQSTSSNSVPNVAEANQATPKSQYPSSMAPKEKSRKSNPDETKHPKDKHVHWKGEDVQKGEKVTVLTPGQKSVQVVVDNTKSAPLADVEEVESMWLMRDDRQKERKTSLDDGDVNLAQSIKSSFGKSTRVTSQSISTSVVTHSKKYSETVTKVTPASGQFKGPDITSYSVQRSEKHESVKIGPIGDPDNKENVANPSENSQNLPKIDDATKDDTKQTKDKTVGGSLFGITGEKRMTDDDKMKGKPKVKPETEKKKIVLPVIRPTDPRRWAIALTDYSHTPQTKQPVSTRMMAPLSAPAKRDPQVETRPKDHRRWGIAPRGRGMAPPHEQYSQEFECKENDAECRESTPDSRRQNVQLSATVATTKPHQSPLLSTIASTKPVLPKLMQPARKTSPGIVYYDDRASALSTESLEDESCEHQLGSTKKTEDVAPQGAVGVSRFRRADNADNVLSDKDIKDDETDPGPPYILYRRVQDGGQPSSVVVTPPQDMVERETIRSYSRRDPDAESILSEDIPMYVRKDQRQDMLASRMGSQSYPLLSTMPPHHASHDSVHSMTEVNADHGKEGFMIYMVTKQSSPEPSEGAVDSDDDEQARYQPSYKSDDTTDDIEYYGPRRIHTKPMSHPSDRNHYHSMPDMKTLGVPHKTGGRPLSARSAPEEDDQPSPNITYKPAYGPYSEMIENTGHTFGIFGQKLSPDQHQSVPKSPKSPRSPRIQRPKGPPPPVPTRKTPVKSPDADVQIKPKTPQEIAAGEGHMFGIFGQQLARDSGHTEPHTSFESLPSSSVKDIMSKLDLFEERGRRMDKTGAGPAVLGQERVEVSLLRQNIVTQAGEPFGERQFVVGKASPMGARLTRPVSFPIGSHQEQFIISPQNQNPRNDAPGHVHEQQGLQQFWEQEQRQQPREQEDLQEEEKVFSVQEIIQKLNTGQPLEVSTKKDATKYEKCPYTAVAKRYIADSEKPRKPMRYDDNRELEDMVPYYDPSDYPQVEKINEFRELEMIYQNTSSIQEYDEEPLRKQQIQETLIDDDIKFMDDTDVTSIDSDTDSGGSADDDNIWDKDTNLLPQESLRRLKPLGEKRVAQIHAIIDKKLGPKKSGERDSSMEDISSYCLSKEKRTLLSNTQKIPSTLKTRYEPPLRTKEHGYVFERKVASDGNRSEPADTPINDGDEGDSTPLSSEESSDNQSVDTQKDVSELPYDEVTKFVDNDHIETVVQVDKQNSELEVKEAIPDEAKSGAEYCDIEDEMSRQAEEEEERSEIQKENEEREKEELLRNEQKIRELEEKLAKLEAPVRDAVKKLLQVSSKVSK